MTDMNAFTQKPDLTKFRKELRHSYHSSRVSTAAKQKHSVAQRLTFGDVTKDEYAANKTASRR
jgi:hypothetical protein